MAGEKGATTNRLLNKMQFALANESTTLTAASTGDKIMIADVSADHEIKDIAVSNILGSTPQAVTAGAAATTGATAQYIDKSVFLPGRSAVITSSGANAVARLPKSSTVPFMTPSFITVTANGCEIRGSTGTALDFINGVNASTGKEMAVAASATMVVFKQAAARYIAFHITSAGAMGSTEATSPVPD